MKLNTPLPQPLSKECAKAAKIFQSFVDSRNNGLDGVIPRSVLKDAKGFAIFTVIKAGFVFSARAGSGVVIAKLEDGTWSAPSAIGTAGVGIGGQVGAEVTDFLVVLNTRAAIRSFMAAGSLTLGGNLSIALGPLGRNGEAIGSVSTSGKVAAMYSYSKTRGLFGGISIEGSVIVERQDANSQAYKSPVTVQMLLSGVVDPPLWAEPLIKTLETCTGMPGRREWVHDDHDHSPAPGYAFAGPSSQPQSPSSSRSRTPSFLRKKKEKEVFPPPHWGTRKEGGSYFFDDMPTSAPRDDPNASISGTGFGGESNNPRQSAYNSTRSATADGSLVDGLGDPFNDSTAPSASPASRGHTPRSLSLAEGMLGYNSAYRPPTSRSTTGSTLSNDDGLYSDSPVDIQRRSSQRSYIRAKPELVRPLMPGEGVARAIALFDFRAVEDGDLSFEKGDVITVIKKSESTDDWWTGRARDREGAFPANFVEIV